MKKWLFLLLTIFSILLPIHASAAENARLVLFMSRPGNKVYIDLDSIKYDEKSKTIRFNRKDIDYFESQESTTMYVLDPSKKTLTSIASFWGKIDNEEEWDSDFDRIKLPIMPDNWTEKASNIVLKELGMKPVFNVKNHRWKFIFKDKDNTYYICTDTFDKKENEYIVYGKIHHDTRTIGDDYTSYSVYIKNQAFISDWINRKYMIEKGSLGEACEC